MRALALVFALLTAPALAQESADRSYLTALLEDNLSGAGRSVVIEGFAGALSSRATFDKLTVADNDGIWLTITDGALAWDRAGVLRGEIHARELSAAKIALERLPQAGSSLPSVEAKPFALPELPVSISLESLDVKEISLGESVLGEPLTAALSGAVSLANGEGKAALSLRRTDAKTGEFGLSASYANASRMVALDLLMDEAQGGIAARKLGIPNQPALRLALAGAGPIDNFSLLLRLSSEGKESLGGALTIRKTETATTLFEGQLSGDPRPLLLADYAPFFGAQTGLDLRGEVTPEGVVLERFAVTSAALTLNAAAKISAGIPETLSLSADVGLGAGEVLLPLSGAKTYLRDGALRLDFDRARSDTWQLDGHLAGLRSEAVEATTLTLNGSGRIRNATAFGGTLRAEALGISFKDKALESAIGKNIGLSTIFAWQEGAPLRVSRLVLLGEKFILKGRASLRDLAQGGRIFADLTAKQTDLAALSAALKRPMNGAVEGRLRGEMTLLSGAFDGRVELTSKGLALGVAALDPLLAGDTDILLNARRDENGLELRQFSAQSQGFSASAAGKLASDGNALTAKAQLNDLRPLGLRGALTAEAELSGKEIRISAAGADLGHQSQALNQLLAGGLRLDILAETAPDQLTLKSARVSNPQLDLTASGSVIAGRHQLALSAKLANMAVIARGFPGAARLEGTISGDQRRSTLALNASGPGGTQAEVSGSFDPAFKALDLAVAGRAELALANGFIEPLSVHGPLGFDLALKGAPKIENLSGRVVATKARLVAPTAKLIFETVDAVIGLGQGRAQISATAALSTGGLARISGPLALKAPFQSDLTVALERLRLRDPQLYDTLISGDISVKGPAKSARISGALSLDETELRIPSAHSAGASDLPEITHLGESAAVRATREKAGLLETASENQTAVALPLDILISAPRAIFVRGRGLDAEMGGALRLRGTSANVRPEGEFSLIRGRLDILGKRFTLSEGQVALQGALTPWVRFVATTQGDISTTIALEGEANAPKITLSSSPDLPQEEVLSRLLFNREITSLSALQAAQLASAVATLAGKGGAGIVSKLRQRTGLDDLDVSTDDAGNTELTVGKYISDKVYTDITVDSGGTSEVHLNLDVTPDLTARGSVGTDGNSGLGMFFERDY